MGCAQFNYVIDQVTIQRKSVCSIKSNKSGKSSFSRKRTKRARKTNKITFGSDEILENNIIDIENSAQLQQCKPIQIAIKPKQNLKQQNPLKLISHKMSCQQFDNLDKSLMAHFYFFKLKKQLRVKLISSLKLYKIRKGKQVYHQNDQSDRVFIVKQGYLEMISQTKQNSQYWSPQKYVEKNQAFGQMSAIFQHRRAQTVIARQNSQLWGLEKQVLQQIQQTLLAQNCNVSLKYLQKVPTFSYLAQEQLKSLSLKVHLMRFKFNSIIFEKGDSSNTFFIITSGQVQLQIPNKDNVISRPGQIFGQGCLKQKVAPRVGTAICSKQSRCLVISRQDFMSSLGTSNIQSISHFSIIKWALKRSQQFHQETNQSLYKRIQKGKVRYFLNQQNIFQNSQNNGWRYYFICLEGHINQFGVGVLVNCVHGVQREKQYVKKGDGNVFMLQIKKPKNLGKSLKMVKFQQKKEVNYRISLSGAYKHPEFNYQQLSKFLRNLILIKRIKCYQNGKGQVYSVFDKFQQKFYNIRCIKKAEMSKNNLVEVLVKQKQLLLRARQCLFLQHLFKTFKDQEHIYLVYKSFQSVSLQKLLQKHKSFSNEVLVHLIACLILGVQYIHDVIRSIHRKIQIENIFLDNQGYFTLCDFDNIKELSQKKSFRTFTIIGTPHYISPQMIQGKGYSFPVDYWALGVVLYRVIYGRFPFITSNKDPFQIFKFIVKNNIEFKPCPHIMPQIMHLMKMLLSSNPQERIKTNQFTLKKHPLFNQFKWKQFERKMLESPIKTQTFGIKKVQKKYYQEGKNQFQNFIAKQKKKINQNQVFKVMNHSGWDFNFQ